MVLVRKIFAYFDPDTMRVTSTGMISVMASREIEPILPENTIDLTDVPELFEAVRENPKRYRVENGHVVLNEDEE